MRVHRRKSVWGGREEEKELRRAGIRRRATAPACSFFSLSLSQSCIDLTRADICLGCNCAMILLPIVIYWKSSSHYPSLRPHLSHPLESTTDRAFGTVRGPQENRPRRVLAAMHLSNRLQQLRTMGAGCPGCMPW